MIIALDFDGTVVTHEYPAIGQDLGAVPVLKALQDNGHQFILTTMRDNHSCGRNCLKEATDWFAENGINLIGINENPWQKSWTDSKKAFANMYIDDAALGAPTHSWFTLEDLPNSELPIAERVKDYVQSSKPHIDWADVACMLYDMDLLTEDQMTEIGEINRWNVNGMTFWSDKMREYRRNGLLLSDSTPED